MQRSCDIAVIPVEGDLDVTSVPRLYASISYLIDTGCRRIILNLGKAQFIDSAGMALILCSIRAMRKTGGLLSLTNVGDQAYRTLCRIKAVDFVPVSRAGVPKQVPALDPRTEPIWWHVLRCDSCSMSVSRHRVKDLLVQTPLTSDETFDMTLACGEALGNAFDHAKSRLTLVTVCYYPDRVIVQVSDNGCGYQLRANEKPKTSTDMKLERGRGIKLMRMLADEVSISMKSGGKGTAVSLTKMIDNK